ncbi:MAG: 2TM domain-containing protein [Flavobacterium sp.]
MNNLNLSPDEIRYQQALKRVKKIKGFYTHMMVYIVINTGLLIAKFVNQGSNDNFWEWQTFNTVIFWGIGLAAHGFSVFLPGAVMGKDWEERKINELMEKEKKNKWE